MSTCFFPKADGPTLYMWCTFQLVESLTRFKSDNSGNAKHKGFYLEYEVSIESMWSSTWEFDIRYSTWDQYGRHPYCMKVGQRPFLDYSNSYMMAVLGSLADLNIITALTILINFKPSGFIKFTFRYQISFLQFG